MSRSYHNKHYSVWLHSGDTLYIQCHAQWYRRTMWERYGVIQLQLRQPQNVQSNLLFLLDGDREAEDTLQVCSENKCMHFSAQCYGERKPYHQTAVPPKVAQSWRHLRWKEMKSWCSQEGSFRAPAVLEGLSDWGPLLRQSVGTPTHIVCLYARMCVHTHVQYW